MSHVIRWVVTKVIVRKTELNNENIYVLQIGAALFYYKLRQVLLQIGAAITNYGKRYDKIRQLLQIGVKYVTNWGRYYNLGQ